MKACNRCGKIKPYSEFGISKRKKGEYTTTCKACQANMNALYAKWKQPGAKTILEGG
jgi:hypothetical protein